MSITKSTILTRLSSDELRASPGKFRVVTLIDSEIYQVNHDMDNLEEARKLRVTFAKKSSQLVTICDDMGDTYL